MIERRILVTGVVQAVGFRPFCAKLALRWKLGGSVSNTSDGVSLVLQGQEDIIDHYIRDLSISNLKPDLAEIHSIETISETPCHKFVPFSIGPTVKSERQRVLLPPDIATCKNCMAEMDDPTNRRYRYPFINCTDCGPRFSIVRELPYDRPQTTMDSFPMCPSCRKEYEDPFDRRFHAQPNACSDCGPRIWSFNNTEGARPDEEGLRRCRDGLFNGEIWAIKGLGGFHIACDPLSNRALSLLRERKSRPHKPLAVMVEDMEKARSVAFIGPEEERLLESPRRPIVLCPTRGKLHPSVAPGQNRLGIMLPYTPLHRLLMEGMGVLVMTSANRSGQPLISHNEEAISELSGIVDGFLLHDRDIQMKIDDSIVAPAGNKTVLLRRGRGYVPNPVCISTSIPQILAAGGEMKSTFSLTQERLIFPSQYLGDCKELPTVEYYKKALRHFLALYNFKPEAIAHDYHPLYLTTRAAKSVLGNLPSISVQHHHAHLAACLAEHDRNEPTIGVILDGTGYGLDGTIWGGEFLVGDWSGFSRAGHLSTCPLPGGDRSVMEPWRYALSLMINALGSERAINEARSLWPDRETSIDRVAQIVQSSPLTSSCGRLFDGIWTLLGGPTSVSYDGQSAGEMEAKAEGPGEIVPFKIEKNGGIFALNWRPFIEWLVKERPSQEEGSSSFHSTLSDAIVRGCSEIRNTVGISTVALAGGVWQNCVLLGQTVSRLEGDGFSVLVHGKLSPNDESISVGQAAIAGWRLKKQGGAS